MRPTNPLFAEIAGESAELLDDVSTATDRASVITAAAVLDDLLALLLRARMVKDDKVGAKLVDKEFSFFVKIDLCYALGLISRLERRDLHMIRKVRNDFAHSRQSISLDDPETRERCRSLALAQQFWALSSAEPSDTKTWFVSGWVLLTNELSLRLNATQHAGRAAEFDGDQQLLFGGNVDPGN